ncbi:hypothetical protein K438DRAFT_1983970 [Mycena galopus ATCC 62051]|nr:hypothetical protein K438DRAFT_1983970 [Mycena galopus ATCC 62051]
MLARLRDRLLKRPARSLHPSASACNSSYTPYDPNSEPLSAAISLKQLESETGNETYPDYPLAQPVTSSGIHLLTEKYSIPNLHPPQMKNKGNCVASISRVDAWLGGIAEVAQFLLFPSPDTEDAQGGGRARVVVGQAVAMYDLRHGKEAQTYEIGVKEMWRVEEREYAKYTPSACTPMVAAVGTVYHMADGPVSISLIVGLDYKIPYIELYRSARNTTLSHVLLAAGTRLAYGARALTEAGLESLLQLDFPGRGMESRSTTLFGEVADAQIFDRCVGELIKTPGTILRSDFSECYCSISFNS